MTFNNFLVKIGWKTPDIEKAPVKSVAIDPIANLQNRSNYAFSSIQSTMTILEDINQDASGEFQFREDQRLRLVSEQAVINQIQGNNTAFIAKIKQIFG